MVSLIGVSIYASIRLEPHYLTFLYRPEVCLGYAKLSAGSAYPTPRVSEGHDVAFFALYVPLGIQARPDGPDHLPSRFPAPCDPCTSCPCCNLARDHQCRPSVSLRAKE